jgi:hypothetical protein
LGKGTTALQNIYFLKLCREFNIFAIWNNLIRIPGEKPENYEKMVELVPQIVHLAPPHSPRGTCRVECHRFSPYFSEKGKWLENIRPMIWYYGLFPEETIDVSRVAYYFDADWNDTLDNDDYKSVTAACSDWNRIWGTGETLPKLSIHNADNGNIHIEDTRFGSQVIHTMDNEKTWVYRSIADPGDLERIQRRIEGTFGKSLPKDRIESLLREHLHDKLAIEEKGKFCALALSENAPEPHLSERARVYIARN